MRTLDEVWQVVYDDDEANPTIHGVPVVFVSRATFEGIFCQLRTVLGRGAGAVAYQVGQEAGRGIVPVLRSHFATETSEDVVEAMRALYARAGWFVLDRFDLTAEGDAHIEIRKSVEALGAAGEASAPVCHFLRGYFAGFVAAITGQENREGRETDCEGRGDAKCVFRIARRRV